MMGRAAQTPGLKQVFSYADVTHVVPEYIETNNWDSIP